jgi:hypothetical protein
MNRIGACALTSLVAAVLLCGSVNAREKSSIDLIEEAYQLGEISKGERIVYRLMTVRDRDNLPAKYQTIEPVLGKDATDIFFEARAYLGEMAPDERSLASKYLARPGNAYSFDSPEGHFKIHYDRTGTNAVPLTDSDGDGIPNYVEWLASYADSSWRCQHTYLGYTVPPTDAGQGGDNKYDVYTEDMGYYGYTQAEGSGSSVPSYVSIENNFSGFPANDDPEGDQKGAMKVTMTHEYFHAVQFGIYSYTEMWFMEVSSTWMEEICFRLVNDNHWYFSYFFPVPYYSLNSTTNYHQYGAFVWNRFIDQYFDTLAVRQVWERIRSTGNSNPYVALSYVFTSRGSSLPTAFPHFCEWNFITGGRNDGSHYEDASEYDYIQIMRTHSAASYPISGQTPVTAQRPSQMGCNYIWMYAPADTGDFIIDFDGQDGYVWTVQVIKKHKGGNIYDVETIQLNSQKVGSDTIPDCQTYDYFILNPIVNQTSGSSLTYTYGARFIESTYAVGVTSNGNVQLYSNTETEMSFTVENTGAIADVFNFSIVDDLSWAYELNPAQKFLDVGESAVVGLTLTCPAGTMPGVVDNIEFTATSTGNPSVHEAAMASAEVLLQHGDANNSGDIDIDDIVYVITYIFASGPSPVPVLRAGDADDILCSGAINVDIDDAVYLITYVFASGPPPPCNTL